MDGPQAGPDRLQAPTPVRGSLVGPFLRGFLVASLLAAGAWWGVRRFGPGWFRLDMSRPSVVRQVQQLQRLETVVFGMDKIVAGERESRYFPAFLVGERLLLIVYGEVTAGVDLAGLQTDALTVDGKTVRLELPQAAVFSTRVDNDRTRVYSRETGLFSRVDPDFESEVRREAEEQIRQAALDNGILDVAAANARITLTSFLHGLGFEQVEVR